MARRKNYQASMDRSAQAVTIAKDVELLQPAPADARIDMVALLGPGARFASSRRVIDLSDWTGRGIDPWILASVRCLKAMLLSGARQTTTVAAYGGCIRYFFEFLTDGALAPGAPRATTPAGLSPLHLQAFVGWLQKLAQARGWTELSTRFTFKGVKSVLVEMFAQGFIPGEASRFFPRAALPWRAGESRQTSLSDAEQERLARAIKSDLVAHYHCRLTLNQSDIQALRLLVVAHRQGLNPTPLLEMRRDALKPGFLPGTVRIRTSKHRNKKILSRVGRASEGRQDLVFSLSEGAVLQQAISSTRGLVDETPAALRDRIWLYRSQSNTSSTRKGSVTCLTSGKLQDAIQALIARHQLLGDDGKPLRLNLSRLRKSFFDRAMRAADGDLAVTTNLMGNTPNVASLNYPSMNGARQAQAAGFMNDEYTAMMRGPTGAGGRPMLQLVEVRQFESARGSAPGALPITINTPVSGCRDTVHGEHAPHDGHNHCDRYVMCLFCSSFVVVGTVEGLWRLFSFQVFAKAELEYLDEALGPERTDSEALENLRDRYRLAIPYIDDFTQRQFAWSRIGQARAKTAAALHPYWQHQLKMSRLSRVRTAEAEPMPGAPQGSAGTGDRVGT